MSKPILITCQPDDQYFLWQNHLYIESCIQRGFSPDQIHILLYTPSYRKINTNWEILKTIYPGLGLYYYQDKGVEKYLGIYIPVIRPHLLWQHFTKFSELETKTIIYTDCDIIWTPVLDIDKYLNSEDPTSYISNASSYLNYTYLKGKERDALEDKKESLKEAKFLENLCNGVGVDISKLIENDNNTGGVQYILKNIEASFWKKIEADVLNIRMYLMGINKQFFASENAGIQSWCADLWAIQWNMWALDKPIKVVPEMEFSWSSDPIEKLSRTGILHNAGITDPFMGGAYAAFYKGTYHTGKDPFDDPHLQVVYNDEETKKRCNHYYLSQLLELKEKYGLKY